MDENSMTLVVFFEDPFFVGVIERVCEGRLTAARHVFGAEPKDAEVYAWVLQNHFADELSPAVGAARRTRHESPKRAKRDAGRHLAREGVGTRSQQALALSREQQRQERKTLSRERRKLEAERRFALRQRKRKEKHRGR